MKTLVYHIDGQSILRGMRAICDLVGESGTTTDGSNLELMATLRFWDRARDMEVINRLFSDAYATLIERLTGKYVTALDDTPRIEYTKVAHDLAQSLDRTINILVTDNTPLEQIEEVNAQIHTYLEQKTVSGWFAAILPEEGAKYLNSSEETFISIKRRLHKRRFPLRKEFTYGSVGTVKKDGQSTNTEKEQP